MVLVAFGIGCTKRSVSATRTTTETNTQAHLMDAKDLDLQAIVGMVKNNKVNGAKELEKAINTTSGINNVDIDKDGKIDYIIVKENRGGSNGAISLDLLALPSSTKKQEEATTVASISFKKNVQSNRVEVSGGYPNYVNGYNNHYYSYHHHGLSFGEGMFLMWMYSAHRPLYYRPMFYRSYYSPRPIYSAGQLRSSRTTYRSQTKVSPVRKASRPKNYNIKSAKKVPSRFKSQTSSGNRFSNRAGKSKKFSTRSNKSNRKSSWGNRSSSKSRSWGSSKPKTRSRSWGGSSSGSRSRSWGGSSGSRSRSWGGSSRSFGGRSRRSDVNFKKNVVSISNALEKVNAMNGVYFNWRKGNTNRQVGVIAQNINKVVPEVVSKNKSGYMVDYAALVPVLIEAIKELNAKQLQQVCR
jgi:hypothetical protein